MTEPMGHTLAMLHCKDGKFNRLQVDCTNLRGRVEWVKRRLTSLDVRLGVMKAFDGEISRADWRSTMGSGSSRLS